MFNLSRLNITINDNFLNTRYYLLIPPFLLLLLCFFFFLAFGEGANYVDRYINLQKDLFFYLNHKLSEYPNLELNLTQIGDAVISFSFLAVFLIYAPKLWEALLTSAVISLIVSFSLKSLIDVPRPSVALDNDSFVIIGKTLTGFSSFPSGHSITTFFVITVLLIALMPSKRTHKILWSFFMLVLGFIIALSRIGVGAHYPIDVMVGSAIGYIIAIIGIKIDNKIHCFVWIKNRKFYPILILILVLWGGLVIKKILETHLFIFYSSFLFLVTTLILVSKTYVQKKN